MLFLFLLIISVVFYMTKFIKTFYHCVAEDLTMTRNEILKSKATSEKEL